MVRKKTEDDEGKCSCGKQGGEEKKTKYGYIFCKYDKELDMEAWDVQNLTIKEQIGLFTIYLERLKGSVVMTDQISIFLGAMQEEVTRLLSLANTQPVTKGN